jgi:glycosyltransferase involved in cell wall biosynthesis
MKSVRLEVINGKVPFVRMPLYMNASDCLLVLSEYEGSPNVVKEALACNLPILSLDVGDVKERLQRVFPSSIVEKNVAKIAAALFHILKLEKRSNGRETITDISLGQTVEKLLEVYNGILKT